MMSQQKPGRFPGDPRPVTIIVLVLVFSFQFGHSPTEIREILITVVMALVALGVVWSLSGQPAN